MSVHGAAGRRSVAGVNVGGIVRLNQSDLEDWLGRQRVRSLARPVFEALGAARMPILTPLELLA